MSTTNSRRTGSPDTRRIAGIRAGGRRGSGYLVDDDTVLTAGHLVRGATEIVAEFGGTWSASAAIVWLDVDADLAVLRLTAGHGQTAVPPVRYGRLGTPPRTLTVQIAGAGQGTAPLPRNADVLAVTLTKAGDVVPGSAVFAEGLVVGVVIEAPTPDDPMRLLAARLDRRFEHTRQGRLLADLLAAGPLAVAS